MSPVKRSMQRTTLPSGWAARLNRPVLNSASARLEKRKPSNRELGARDWPGRSVSVGYQKLSQSTLPLSPMNRTLPVSLSARTDPRCMLGVHSTSLPSVSVSWPSVMLRTDRAEA
jgi:hypothetical protein